MTAPMLPCAMTGTYQLSFPSCNLDTVVTAFVVLVSGQPNLHGRFNVPPTFSCSVTQHLLGCGGHHGSNTRVYYIQHPNEDPSVHRSGHRLLVSSWYPELEVRHNHRKATARLEPRSSPALIPALISTSRSFPAVMVH